MSMRHFVPGAFVVALLFSLLMFLFSMGITAQAQLWLRAPILLLGVIYGAASIGVACHVALRERAAGALLMPIAFLLLHVSYGAGTLSAIVTNGRRPSSELTQPREIARPS
jgi:hypothetical protein